MERITLQELHAKNAEKQRSKNVGKKALLIFLHDNYFTFFAAFILCVRFKIFILVFNFYSTFFFAKTQKSIEAKNVDRKALLIFSMATISPFCSFYSLC